MRHKRPIALLILMALALVAPQEYTLGARRLSSLRHDLAKTTSKISSVRNALRKTKKARHSAAVRLEQSEKKLQISRTSLTDIRSQLRRTRGHLSVTHSKLSAIQARLSKRTNLLNARLVDNYKHGGVSYLNVVLGSSDFWDLLNRGYVVKRFMQHDTTLIDQIKRDRQEVKEHKARLERQENERARLESTQSSLTRAVATQTFERSQVLKDITREQAYYEEMLEKLERDSNSIARLIRSMQATPKGRSRLAKPWKGRFSAPVSSYRITDRFGMRYHPILHRRRMHTGVDLACPQGTPIHAAAGGVVIYAGYMGAYGNTVIIDHGGGVTTVYGHQSSISVRNGQSVRQGQKIGRVGSTGWSTGPHVHFEVRHNGRPVRPL